MVDLMVEALNLAHEALQANEVPVGCIFVRNNKIIAKSRNTVNETKNPTRHAEINCIDQVIFSCKVKKLDVDSYFKHIIVYVTVEPCIMCASALNKLQVQEVVYGCVNDRFGGKTVFDVSQIYKYNFKLSGNVLYEEALNLLKQFYKGTNPNAPESKVKKKKARSDLSSDINNSVKN